MLRVIAFFTILSVAAFGASDTPPPDADEPLHFADALQTALRLSPALAAYSWELRAADARIVQAGLLPNPVISLEVEELRWQDAPGVRTEGATLGLEPGAGAAFEAGRDYDEGAGSGFGAAEYTLTLSELVELGGKRAKRVRLAREDASLTRWDYEVARADLLSDVARAYAAALAAQNQLELASELVGFAREVGGITDARVEAGQVSPIESRKASVEITVARAEEESARREFGAAKQRLAGLMGLAAPSFQRVQGQFPAVTALPPLDKLRDRLRENPDLARWASELDRRQAALSLERSRRIPDVEVSVGLKAIKLEDAEARGFALSPGAAAFSHSQSKPERDWDTSLVLEVSVPLPIFDRNQGGVREAEYMVSKAADERRAAELTAGSALAEWHERARAARILIERIEGDALPEAAEVFDLIQEGFRQGKFEYLDVLDAQRTLFDLNLQLLEARVGLYDATVEIERLIGAINDPAADPTDTVSSGEGR